MDDLEFGGEFLLKKYKHVLSVYRRKKAVIKRFFFAFVVLSLALIVKVGFRNFDTVIETATAITMDEESYVPFKLGDFVERPPESTKQFPIKDSMVNRRMQSLNLEDVSFEVRSFLEKTGNICIHLRHFSLPWDIVVFPNMTVINPQIISTGEGWKNVPEMSVGGEEKWSRRATSVYVKFYSTELIQVYETLWYEQAYCLAFYM